MTLIPDHQSSKFELFPPPTRLTKILFIIGLFDSHLSEIRSFGVKLLFKESTPIGKKTGYRF